MYKNLIKIHEFTNQINYFSYNIYIKTLILLFLSFSVFLFFTPIAIKFFKLLNIKQYIKKDIPINHIKKKNIPAIGGILIILTSLLSLWVIFPQKKTIYIIYLIFTIIGYGLIGFLDDYLKIKNKNGHGLSWKWKYFLLSIISIILSILIVFYKKDHLIYENIKIFGKNENIINICINICLYYLIFIGTSNAVNIADGLDGLAIVPIIFINTGYLLFSLIHGNMYLSSIFYWKYNKFFNEILLFNAGILGSSLGFLWFNSYPAKIFMGDTGALSLGGYLAITSIFLQKKIFLIISGGIFILETLSILLQIIFHKITKKKFFLMSPIHHHYEIKGIPESIIVIRFWIISYLFFILGIVATFFKIL